MTLIDFLLHLASVNYHTWFSDDPSKGSERDSNGSQGGTPPF